MFVGILLGFIVALRMVTARALAAPPGLRFEEEDPDAIFEGFRLSEGLAAEPTAPPPASTRPVSEEPC